MKVLAIVDMVDVRSSVPPASFGARVRSRSRDPSQPTTEKR
jgi:hypothetical protein